MPNTAIEATALWVRGQMAGEATGHDWWHTQRVWHTARQLAEAEGADTRVVELAALLHDIQDYKFSGDAWHSTRDGSEFFADLSRCASEQAAMPLLFAA